MTDICRRDFIKLTGMALGGVILTSCGSSGGGGGGTTTPNGYYFYRLKTTGEQTGTDSKILKIYEFGASAHISDGGIITFDAWDVEGNQGLFQLNVDFSSKNPSISQEYTAVTTGDILSDDREVRKFTSHDVNREGNIAAVIKPSLQSESHYGDGLYLNNSRGGFEKILGTGETFHQDQYESTGILGDVSLHNENSLLFTAHHLTGTAPKSSLFHLPGASLSESNLMMSTGDYINGTDNYISGFGIVDHHASGYFSTTVSHLSSGLTATATSDDADEVTSTPVNGLLHSAIETPNDHILLSAGADNAITTHTADIHYGPRVAEDGTVYAKIADAYKESLICGEQVIKTTDSLSASGSKISSFSPGCVGADGVFYYTQYSETDDGLNTELVSYNGSDHTIILSQGNTLTDGGSPVKNILFSTTTNHVDPDGKIVLICEFEDKSMALVVGIPA